MSQNANNELIDTIVAKVLASLSGQTVGDAPKAVKASDAPAQRLDLAGWKTPPIERKGPPPVEYPRPQGKVFLTADMLGERLAGSGGDGGIITLAHNEYLTPNARDLLEMKHLSIRKSPAPLLAPAAVSNAPLEQSSAARAAITPAGGQAGVVTDHPDDKVNSTIRSLAYDGLTLKDFSRSDCWMSNLPTMCKAIVAGEISTGIALLPYAADAMVLANKFPGIRAVYGTRDESVSSAARRFDANLLILEHVYSTYHEMRKMIRTFTSPRAAEPTCRAFLDMISELERT